MKPASRASRSSWILLLLAFALLCVANGRWLLAPAAWLAPLFLLLFIDSRPVRSGLGWAGLAQLLAFFVNWQGLIPVPGLWYYLVAGIYALAYFLPFVIHRLIASPLAAFRYTLVLPVSWVAIEFLFQKFVTPYGSWASLAYTQVEFLPLIQLASVTGAGGIHFVMLWSVAVVSWAWRYGRPFARVRTGVLTLAAVLALLLIWGQWRIVSAPAAPRLLRVATLTPSAELSRELQREMSSSQGAADAATLENLTEIAGRLNDDLLQRTEREAAAGAELIAWSEHAARVTRGTEPALIERGQTLARSAGVHLILGVGLWNPDSDPPFENKTIMINAAGAVSGTYHKARPIVGRESGKIAAGNTRIGILETDLGRFGVVICHDLDFPDLVREAGRLGVDVLFAPSADWETVAPLHARMATLRAVENGCSLVRPCSNGLSLVADPLGRIIDSQLDGGERGNGLGASVPVSRLRTAYPVLGDSFAYANLVVLALLFAGRLRGARSRRRFAKGAST